MLPRNLQGAIQVHFHPWPLLTPEEVALLVATGGGGGQLSPGLGSMRQKESPGNALLCVILGLQGH